MSGTGRKRPSCTSWCKNTLRPFFAQVEAETGSDLPDFVKDEFDVFLECGVLAHGFLRLRCADCIHEKLIAFSCKRRGFCPSCGGRRMAQTAAHLVDHVIPNVPVRQWVLSLPIPLRYLFATHPYLISPVLQVISRAISTFLIKQAGFKRSDAQTGAITLIQSFGSAANLNIHLHCLVLDGVYRIQNGMLEFRSVRSPTAGQLQALLSQIIQRVMKVLTRHGALIEEEGMTYLADIESDVALAPLQSAACTYRIALGPRAGQKLLTLKTVATQNLEQSGQECCVNAHSFSLHAGVRCAMNQRNKLERLCRYITRSAIADECLARNKDGQIVLTLKAPYRDGTTHIVLSPLEFMQRNLSR